MWLTVLKAILQIGAAIATFVIGLWPKMVKSLLRKLIFIVCAVLIINGILMCIGDLTSDEEKKILNHKIDALSDGGKKHQETINNLLKKIDDQKTKIDRLLADDVEKQDKIDNLTAMNDKQRLSMDNLELAIGRQREEIEEQSEKIDGLTREIARLNKILEDSLMARLEKTDSYVEAKKLYNSAITFMNYGNQRKAAQKFLEFREIALKEGAYEAVAISSLIASYRFSDVGEEAKAAQLQSEAADFFIKLNRYDEAKIWKSNAKKIYEKQGTAAEVLSLDKEIKTLELKLNK